MATASNTAAGPIRPASADAPRRPTWRAAAVLAVVTFAVFAPSLGHDFIALDDTYNVYLNPHLHPVTWENFWFFWKNPYERNYVPVVYTTHAVEMLLWGDYAPGYRVVNVGFHIAGTLLLFLLFCRLGIGAGPAAIGCLIFAIHPMQIESVVWITGRWAVLSGCLVLWSAWEYVRWVEKPGVVRYVLAMLGLVLAMLAKPSAACFPFMVFCIDAFVLKRPLRRILLGVGPLLLLTAGTVGLLIVTKVQPITQLTFVAPWLLRPVVAADALAFYLYKFLFPIWLGPDYGRSPAYVLQHGWVYLTAVVPLLIIVLIWARTGRSVWLAAAGLFIAGALPTLGFIPFMFQEYTTVADRYAYLSLIGPALALGWFLTRTKIKFAAVISIVLLAALGLRTVLQARHWRNSDTFCAHALRVNPESCMMQALYGNVLSEQNRLDEAIGHYNEALRIRPAFPEAHNNLGTALIKSGRVDEAIEHFAEAVKLRPDFISARTNLAGAFFARGQVPPAIIHFEKALEQSPDDPLLHKNLAAALLKNRQIEQAIEHYRQALSLKGDLPGVHTVLGDLLTSRGQVDQAIEHYRQALQIKPDSAKAANGLAWIFATRTETRYRKPARAVELAELACKLTGRKDPSYLDTLAAAYAAAGRFQEAITTAEQAVDLAAKANQQNLADEIRKRLQLFRSNQPFQP